MSRAAVLFDVDGTLVQTLGAGRRALEEALERWLGRPLISRGFDFSGRTDLEILRHLSILNGVQPPTDGDRRRILDDYLIRLEEELRAGPSGRACEGVDALLRQLASDPRWTVGVVTGNISAGAAAKLRRFGLERHFAIHDGKLLGAFGDDHENRRRLVPIALARIAGATGHSVPASRAVIIGDTSRDIDCARAAGAPVVAVATGFSAEEELRTGHPDAVLPDLTDTAAVCGLLNRLANLETT